MCASSEGVDIRSCILLEDTCPIEGVPNILIVTTRHIASWAWSFEKFSHSILSRLRNIGKGKNHLGWTLSLPDYWKGTYHGANGIGPLFYAHDSFVGDDDHEKIAFQNVVHLHA